ncbi:unnamed protein product [Closterium sp. NIES-53]
MRLAVRQRQVHLSLKKDDRGDVEVNHRCSCPCCEMLRLPLPQPACPGFSPAEQCCIVRITHVHQTLISPREAQLPVCSFLRQRLDRTQENAAHPTYLAKIPILVLVFSHLDNVRDQTHRVRQPSSWIVTASFVLVGSEAEAAKLSTGFMKCLPRTSQCISKSSLGSPSFPGALSFAIERKARFTSFSVQSADTPSADACDNLLPSAGSQAVSVRRLTIPKRSMYLGHPSTTALELQLHAEGSRQRPGPNCTRVIILNAALTAKVISEMGKLSNNNRKKSGHDNKGDRVEHAVEAVTFAERGMLLNLERILHQHLPDQLRQDVSRNDA